MEYWWNYNDLEKIRVPRQSFVPLSLCNEHPTGASMGLNPGFRKVYFKITIFTALSLYIYIRFKKGTEPKLKGLTFS